MYPRRTFTSVSSSGSTFTASTRKISRNAWLRRRRLVGSAITYARFRYLHQVEDLLQGAVELIDIRGCDREQPLGFGEFSLQGAPVLGGGSRGNESSRRIEQLPLPL